jgi:hypothetical protein
MFSQVGLEDHLSLQQNVNSRALFLKISPRLTFTAIFKRGEAYKRNSPYEDVQIYIFLSSSSHNMSVVDDTSGTEPIPLIKLLEQKTRRP